jgi:hypothetical protein
MSSSSTIVCKIKHLLNYSQFSNLLHKENKYSNLINEIKHLNYISWNKEYDLQELNSQQLIIFIIECSFNSKSVFFNNKKHDCFFDIVDYARLKNPQCKKYNDIFETLNINTNTYLLNELRELIRAANSESFESKLLHYMSYVKNVSDDDDDDDINDGYTDDGYDKEKNNVFDLYTSVQTKFPITNENKNKLNELRDIDKNFPEIFGINLEEQISDSLDILERLSKFNLNTIISFENAYSNSDNNQYFLYFKLPDSLAFLYQETNEIFSSRGFVSSHEEDQGRVQNFLISKLNASKFFELAIKLKNKSESEIEFPSNGNKELISKKIFQITRETEIPEILPRPSALMH